MIRADELLKFTALDNLIDLVEAYPSLVTEAVRDSFNRNIKPEFLGELRAYPTNSPSLPFTWSADPVKQARARRGYHALIRKGVIPTSGGRYVRTGQTAAGWDVDVIVGDGSVIMVARHNGRGRARRGLLHTTGERQVPSHAMTGWVQHKKTITFWVEAAQEDAMNAVRKILRGQ